MQSNKRKSMRDLRADLQTVYREDPKRLTTGIVFLIVGCLWLWWLGYQIDNSGFITDGSASPLGWLLLVASAVYFVWRVRKSR